MHADPVEYKTSTIMPLASVSMPGYAATALVTHRSGKREALGILGYARPSKRLASLRLNTRKPTSTVGDTPSHPSLFDRSRQTGGAGHAAFKHGTSGRFPCPQSP
jgi:hypothetical protein